jgi:hypothetical protein
MPLDTLSNDLWNWHIDLSADVQAVDGAVRRGHYAYISPGPIHWTRGDGTWVLSLRDPDGHATMLSDGVHRP